jgi:putative peptide zinc metalloprotease protein
VLPPPIVEKRDDGAHLPAWHGSPFSPENVGALLTTGQKLCQIGDPHLLEARLVIDQNDVEFVHEGQPVEIMLDQTADYVYTNCFIERVSSEDLKISPAHLSSLNGGSLPTKMDAGGVARPLGQIFEALVPLPTEDEHNLLRLGLVGRAKITTAPRTLWSRLYRYAAHTFNFEL